METNPAILAAREKLKARMKATQTGGTGSVRRKKQTSHKASGADDKKLQGTIKKLGVHPIAAIEEVNMFLADGNVIHFENPKST
jgi:nascent polypeptide-associated complex subunit beta